MLNIEWIWKVLWDKHLCHRCLSRFVSKKVVTSWWCSLQTGRWMEKILGSRVCYQGQLQLCDQLIQNCHREQAHEPAPRAFKWFKVSVALRRKSQWKLVFRHCSWSVCSAKAQNNRYMHAPSACCYSCFWKSISALPRPLTPFSPAWDLPPILFLISLKAPADTCVCFGTDSSGSLLTFLPLL